MLFASLLFNLMLAAVLFVIYMRLIGARKVGVMYRRLKSHLHGHMDEWEHPVGCYKCLGIDGEHTINCPTMAIRMSIAKAEQEGRR